MKSKNHLSFVFFSLFLLFLAIGLLLFQLSKVPKEVEAVVGTLNLNAQTANTLNTPGGIWNTSGNVGIGTTAPGYKLDVAGTGNFTGTVTAAGLTVSGSTNICSLVAYTDISGITYCPAGFYVWSANAATTGQMLCCKVSNPI